MRDNHAKNRMGSLIKFQIYNGSAWIYYLYQYTKLLVKTIHIRKEKLKKKIHYRIWGNQMERKR